MSHIAKIIHRLPQTLQVAVLSSKMSATSRDGFVTGELFLGWVFGFFVTTLRPCPPFLPAVVPMSSAWARRKQDLVNWQEALGCLLVLIVKRIPLSHNPQAWRLHNEGGGQAPGEPFLREHPLRRRRGTVNRPAQLLDGL